MRGIAAKDIVSEAGGSSERATKSGVVKAPPKQKSKSNQGAKHKPIYVDSSAEYISVRKSDLREISKFGWLEEGIGGAGMFFVSGSFWLGVTLYFEHGDDLKKYLLAFAFCLVCFLFGLVLLWVAHTHFKMRSERIDDYFKSTDSG